MRRVIIESPFAPRTALPNGGCACSRNSYICRAEGFCHATRIRSQESTLHARYLDACLLDSLRRGEAPFASHGLYTRPGVLDDLKPEERQLGIAAGFVWREAAEGTAFYVDLGWSGGMHAGERDVEKLFSHWREARKLGGGWTDAYERLRK